MIRRLPRGVAGFGLFAAVLALAAFAVRAADEQKGKQPPKVSSFAPAGDLISQVNSFVAELDEIIGDEKEFATKSRRKRVAEMADSTAVMALALALHDEKHPLKKSAEPLLQAAKTLSQAASHGEAKSALAGLKQAAEGKAVGQGAKKLTWDKVAPQSTLMQQVGIAETTINRGLRRLARRPQTVQRASALLAVIAQQVIYDPPKGTPKDKLAQWQQLCAEMRDIAGEINRAAHAKDAEKAAAAAKRLTKNCEQCHEGFRDKG